MFPLASIPAFSQMRDRTGWSRRKIQAAPFSDSPRTPQQFPTVFPTTKISHLTTGYTTVTPCLQQTHGVAYTSGHSRPLPLRPRILSNVSSMEGEDDQRDLLFRGEDGWRWCNQSSPSSVTKTRFRSKLLRTLFLSHLATDLRMQKAISTAPHLSEAPDLSMGWRWVPGDGEEECEPPMGHERVAPRSHSALFR